MKHIQTVFNSSFNIVKVVVISLLSFIAVGQASAQALPCSLPTFDITASYTPGAVVFDLNQALINYPYDTSVFFDCYASIELQGSGCFHENLLIEPSPDGSCNILQWEIILSPDAISEACCGTFSFPYFISFTDPAGGPNLSCVGTINLTIECGRTDCGIIDFTTMTNAGGVVECVNVCENSTTVAFAPTFSGSGYTYNWVAGGGAIVSGQNTPEATISWGPSGPGYLIVTITNSDPNFPPITYEICINILEGPTAFFTSSNTACLDAPVQFNNGSSLNSTNFLWDFGDGSPLGIGENPSHEYTAPGTYTVTLTVSSPVYDNAGNIICICSDSYTSTVVVGDLVGPEIFWISTLCENDTSSYWTNSNCGTYVWDVLDANGNPVTFSGQGTNTIFVQWGLGPFGTVSLAVSGCTPAHCPDPTTVQVPIIPANGQIGGPIVVCLGEIVDYNITKWVGVDYVWTSTGGTIIQQDGQVVTIQWNTIGTHVINLSYNSPFLQNLPGHTPPDCSGSATLSVDVLPEFSISPPYQQACIGTTSTFTVIAPSGGTFNWNVPGSLSYVPSGPYSIDITWPPGSGGTYNISASPDAASAGLYCNSTETAIVQVVEIVAPTSITGPIEVCSLTQQYIYEVAASTGLSVQWTATSGSGVPIVNPATGSFTQVTWGTTGPYTLAASYVMNDAPFCASDPFILNVQELVLDPLSQILPATTVCANTTSTYNLTSLHPDATSNWTIVPAEYGSVVSGQGTDNIQIQWNDIPTASQSVTIIATAELCGNTLAYTLALTLNKAIVPIVVGTDFCLGNLGDVTVTNSASFSSFDWSPTYSSTLSSIQPASAGEYIVNTIDSNGCAASGGAIISLLPAPILNLTTNGPTTLVNGGIPTSTDIVAPTNPGYTYSWTCSGCPSPVVFSPTTSTITHNWIGIPPLPQSYTYTVTVFDGPCSSTESITINEINPGGPPGCTPQPYTLAATATSNPECDTWSFSSTSTNVTGISWNFDDGGTSTSPSPTYTYSQIGYYNVTLSGSVPNISSTGFCPVLDVIQVIVPMIAQYSPDITCTPANAAPELCLTDETAFLPSTSVVATNFTIGASTGSISPFCSTSFSLGSTVNTQLIAVHSSGCTSTATQTVTIPGPVTISPVPDLCLEEAGAFNASCTGAVSFDWNFNDSGTGAVDALFNGASASHAYADNGLNTGPYNLTVTVVATHVGGCEFSASIPVVVNDLPAQPTIISQDGDFMFCLSGGVEILELSPVPSAGVTVSWWEGNPTNIVGSGPSLSVTLVGTYGVTITDNITGCSVDVDPVDVQAWPPVPAGIAGPDILCTGDCAQLVGPTGDYTYSWSSTSNPSLGNLSSITICDYSIISPETFTLDITDNVSLCSVQSTHIVTVAPTPIVTAGTWPIIPCEGTNVTLLVDPIDPALNYVWSGGNPNPYVTSASGTYTVIGTDPSTGCKGTATVEIYPCPNLCQVPTGCYTACDTGKTICGPVGLASYQWNYNYAPIAGETAPCITAFLDGIYTLTATNGFGCEKTSDILDLTFINCAPCAITPSDISSLNLTSLGTVLQPIAQTGAIQNVACCLWSINPTLAPGSLLDPTLLCMDVFWGDGTSQLNMPLGSPLEHCYFDECTDYNISVKIFCCANPGVTVGISGVATCACIPDCYVRTSFWESSTPTADGLRCTVTFTSTDYLGPDMFSSQNPNWTIYDINGLPVVIPVSGVLDLTIDLPPGTYTVCRSIEGVSLLDEICVFEHCHDIVVDCCVSTPASCPDCATLVVDMGLVDLGTSVDAAGVPCCSFGVAPHLIIGCNIPATDLCIDIDWGDGTSLFNLSFTSGYTHCYAASGDYIVTMTVYCCSQGTAAGGQSWTFTSPATCINPNTGVCVLQNTGDFFYNETALIACLVGCDISFLPQGIEPGFLVSWDFGDGSGTAPLPPGPVYHCYNAVCGTYLVTMTVTCENDTTLFYTVQKTVVVNCGGVDCWTIPTQCPGDFNNDGYVGVNDLLDVLGAFGGFCF